MRYRMSCVLTSNKSVPLRKCNKLKIMKKGYTMHDHTNCIFSNNIYAGPKEKEKWIINCMKSYWRRNLLRRDIYISSGQIMVESTYIIMVYRNWNFIRYCSCARSYKFFLCGSSSIPAWQFYIIYKSCRHNIVSIVYLKI